jgi:periplasmic protein TonB
MTSEIGAPLFGAGEREGNRSWSVVVSLAIHAGAIILSLVLCQLYYRSEEFKRPPTFTLVNFPPPMPEAPKSQPPQKAKVRQPSAQAPAKAEQPQVQEPAPDLADKNPVPAAEPVAQPPAAEPTGGGAPAGATADAGQPVSVGSASVLDNTSFSPIFNPKPVYPAIAIKANIEGYVDMELVVTPAGSIESFAIIKVWGHPSFGEETAKVIRRWRFPPPRIGGKAVKIRYDYRVNFTLD